MHIKEIITLSIKFKSLFVSFSEFQVPILMSKFKPKIDQIISVLISFEINFNQIYCFNIYLGKNTSV
jgi:hypothetical protein